MAEPEEAKPPVVSTKTITGQIVNEKKAGIAGAVANEGEYFPALKFELVTDAEGKYSCVVPPGPIKLRLNSIVDGYEAADSWLPREQRGRFEIPVQELFDLGVIKLVKRIPIQGQLVDMQNKPLVDWSVYGYPNLRELRPSMKMNSMAGVHTNEQGAFSGNYPETYPPAFWTVSQRI